MLDSDAIGAGAAREWQQRNDELPAGKRLLPAVPFVLGGKGGVHDLKAVDLIELLALRHDIAQQIKDLLDGSRVLIDFVDD